jgi:carbamoyltransferase
MANAFDTKPEHYERFRAGTHPYDRSVRPQVVTKDANPQYYSLIEEFAALTGTGALLNTSLNLHGLPLVNDHRQAFHVLDNSGLDFLLIEDVLLVRKKTGETQRT